MQSAGPALTLWMLCAITAFCAGETPAIKKLQTGLVRSSYSRSHADDATRLGLTLLAETAPRKPGPQRSLLQGGVVATCVPVEYYCGTSDLILDVTYDAVINGPCTQDTVLAVWVCGTSVVSNPTYASIKSGNCRGQCLLIGGDTGIGSHNYWSVSEWSACPSPCDGGVQTRTAICISAASGRQIGNLNCDKAQQPAIRRPCGVVPCSIADRGAALRFTPYGPCSAPCGAGYAARAAYCASLDANLADPSTCPGNYTGTALSKQCAASGSCARTASGGPSWRLSQWSTCSALGHCGGGNTTRILMCMDAKGVAVDAAACGTPPEVQLTQRCNTGPCFGYIWQVGAFGACSQPCANPDSGISARSVTCVNQQGEAVPDADCPSPRPGNETNCNATPCNFCATTTCSGQGACRNGVCTCTPGYRGQFCEIPPSCPGILDANGNCCAHGVVSYTNTTCCGPLAVLDVHGECCESGSIDACGACDGGALAVDVEGLCCGSGVLDGAGYCCASAALDECGICDGDSASCALLALVDVQVVEASVLFDLGPAAFRSTFVAFVAALAGLSAAQLTVEDAVVAPGVEISLNNAANIPMEIQFQAQPLANPTIQNLKAADVTRALQNAVGASTPNQLFLLQRVRLVERAAVCGNGVCESGERPSPKDQYQGCAQDCPFVLDTCPVGANRQQCSGHGRCLSASGTCVCFTGYTSPDCSLCGQGFIRFGSACARYAKAVLPYIPADNRASTSITIAVACIAAVFLLALIILLLFLCLRRRRAGWTPLTGAKRPRRSSSASLRPGSRAGSGAWLAENGSASAIDVAMRTMSASAVTGRGFTAGARPGTPPGGRFELSRTAAGKRGIGGDASPSARSEPGGLAGKLARLRRQDSTGSESGGGGIKAARIGGGAGDAGEWPLRVHSLGATPEQRELMATKSSIQRSQPAATPFSRPAAAAAAPAAPPSEASEGEAPNNAAGEAASPPLSSPVKSRTAGNFQVEASNSFPPSGLKGLPLARARPDAAFQERPKQQQHDGFEGQRVDAWPKQPSSGASKLGPLG